ncbi:GNAT family N-acetyltransferase [Mesobaculum littorinae]|uniref:GNAT family N-acetyltransferase n=1 Tax=Mesobaculum littorinae TaxID=2486419 RepID=A0A438AJZ4_9RHOB|nr:GNAT family N-acetyltransferase [Mesobaculum littorinae]RVV98917.1 GNAT family N-acetyltransferase [Mesobaculum littorinae]
MLIRPATSDDADAVSLVLRDLVAAGKRQKASDPDFARANYITHPDEIRCSLAIDEAGEVMGFQSLRRASEGNPYGTPSGWGIIGTHIRPTSARRGVGRRLFAATLEAARTAGVPAIEAFIAATNAEGIAYYAALGFETYRPVYGVDCRRLLVS